MDADANKPEHSAGIRTPKPSRLERDTSSQLGCVDSERQFRLLVNGVSDYALYMLDPSGIVTSWNSGAEKIKGYKAEEIIGQHFSKFYLPDDRAAGLPERSLKIAREQGRFEAEAKRIRKNGSTFWANVVIDPIYDDDGHIIGFAKITRDITERRKNEEWLTLLANTDTLTGLYNRFAIKRKLEEAVAAGVAATFLLIDLDDFKGVNDSLGHTAGDGFLGAVAKRIVETVHTRGTIGRLGGDEFAIVVAGNADPIAAAQLCSELIEKFRKPVSWQGQEAYLGLSIGIALCPEHGTDPEDIITSADLALYRAKHDGGNRYSLFVPSLRQSALARRTCEQQLREAIARDELELHYQPQISLADDSIVGAEALLRWRHPQHGLLAPGAFLHVVTSSPLAPLIDSLVIRKACAHANAVRSMGQRDFRVAVNVTGAQLQTGELVKTVVRALEANTLSPNALELEITESVILKNDDTMVASLQALRSLGVGIAFDDYGTGFASLSLLKWFPLTRLKIDQGFIRDMSSDRGSAAVVESVIYLGKSFGLDVIAEGIEFAEQVDQLKRFGCLYGQGYFYWRPMPFEALTKLLAGQRTPISPRVEANTQLLRLSSGADRGR